MRGIFAVVCLFIAGCASASSGAVTPEPNGSARCRIVEGEKYLKSPIGSGMICREIERAIEAQAFGARISAEVRATSPSRLAATLIVNGKTLPEHKFVVMDSNLTPASVQRFARSLALAAAEAAKR
jgi:hypothetical protein